MVLKSFPNILLVDDSTTNLLLLSRAMKAKGFLVETAASGAEALELINNHSFGLILLDLLMPGLDGLEVCQRLSQHPQRAQFKVVICSGCDELEVIQNTLGTGADAYFVKEGTPEEFADRLAALFAGETTTPSEPL